MKESFLKTVYTFSVSSFLLLSASYLFAGQNSISLSQETEASTKVAKEGLEIGNGELTVELGTNPSAAEERVIELLIDRINDRTGIALEERSDKAKYHLVIGTLASNNRIKSFVAKCKEISRLG